MDIDGDIRVWTEGDKVCARLHANGPEGPIVVQASAPLAPIRKRLVRALARRGVTISGTEPGYGATIESIARKKALKRLQHMAPAAFSKRGLASYLARSELMKRHRRRKALARAGQPVGAKAIGPIPAAGPSRQKRRRRSRRFGKWARPLVPAALVATTAALTPFIARQGARPTARALPPSPPPPPRPVPGPAADNYGSPGGAAPSDAGDSAAEEEPYEDEAQTTAPGASSRTEASEDNSDGGAPDAGDSEADDSETGAGDEDGGEDGADAGGGEDAEVGFAPAPPAPGLTRSHVRQAMVLLHAARRHPRARRRLRQIVQLAGVGEPAAKKALTALKVAKKIKAKKKTRTAKVTQKPLAQPPKALVVVKASPALAPTPAPSTTSTLRRWLDVFAPWRRGVG